MDLVKLFKDNHLVIPLLGAPGIKLTQTTLIENLTSSECQYRSICMLLDRFNPDGIFPFMDLTVEVEALGAKINFPQNDNPAVAVHAYKTRDDLQILKTRWHGIDGRMKVFIDVMEKLANINAHIIKGGYVIGPFSMVGELMGANDIALNVMLNPDLVHEYLEFCTVVISEYANALFEAGADIIAVLEPTAVILSPQQYEDFSRTYFKKLLSKVNNKPLILHICGNTNHLIGSMIQSGAIGLSLDSVMDFKKLKEIVPKDIALIGNLDPTSLFLQSTPEEVAQATKKLKEDMIDAENFVLSSGCDIPLATPLENIEAFMKAARENLKV